MKTYYFDHYIVPALYKHDNYKDFLDAHNATVNCDYDKMNGIPFNFMMQIIKDLGYNIEVTEVSAADKVIGSIKGKNWHRTHTYRWSIVYWDVYGTMISLTHSDFNNVKFFDSEDAAYRNAIDFIIEHYQQLEQ